MRYHHIIILSIFFLSLPGSFSLFGQVNYEGTFHVDSLKFFEHNDSLFIGFDIRIDSHAVSDCISMIFEPELKDDNKHHLTCPYILINGETRSRLTRRWFTICSDKWLSGYRAPKILINVNQYTGERMSYTFSVPYESWMDECRLILKQEIIGCGGEEHLYTYTLSDQVTTAFREPYQVQPLICLVTPADEIKTRNRQGSAFLDFQVNRSVILPDFRRNPVELAKINDALVEVMGDTDSQITGLFIEGYASPEGRYSNNERLARERATALKDYISNRYILPDNLFTVQSIAEDWAGLKTLVENSDIPNKERVLTIIDNGEDYDRREQQLKALSVYPRLLRDFFPDLRRVEYQIDYTVRNYNTTEARSLINTNPENLSLAELYRVALEYGEDTREYRQIIMETSLKYYGENAVALNNAAALMLKNNEINTARRLLEGTDDIPAVWNNLGVVYLLQDELDKAEELFNRASLAGVEEAAHNLQEVAAKRNDNMARQKRR